MEPKKLLISVLLITEMSFPQSEVKCVQDNKLYWLINLLKLCREFKLLHVFLRYEKTNYFVNSSEQSLNVNVICSVDIFSLRDAHQLYVQSSAVNHVSDDTQTLCKPLTTVTSLTRNMSIVMMPQTEASWLQKGMNPPTFLLSGSEWFKQDASTVRSGSSASLFSPSSSMSNEKSKKENKNV